jgi:hypothetical protein
MIMLDQLPIWAIYVGTVVLILIFAEIGFRIGIWLHRRETSSRKTPMTGAVVGSMLSLVAFLLAFSMGIVINQHNTRKELVVIEANAVGAAYLRAGFLDDVDRFSTHNLLREYVDVRLAAATDPALLESTLNRSEEIHGLLWSIVEDYTGKGQESAIMALFVDSINEVIKIHNIRFTAAELRLPRQIGVVLYVTTMLSSLLVGVASSSDGKPNPIVNLLLALAFVTVLIIIVDLDRPQQGLITVSQTALSDLLQQMATPVP